MLIEGNADLLHFNAQEPGDHTVVDHVADELAELGVGDDRRHQLVKGHGIKHQIAAQAAEAELLVVNHGGVRLERLHVLFSGVGIHRHQEINFFLARDVAVLRSANREPGRQAGNVRREKVLARDRDAHLEQGPEKDGIGRLAARAVDRRYLDAEVIKNAGPPRRTFRLGRFNVSRCHENATL